MNNLDLNNYDNFIIHIFFYQNFKYVYNELKGIGVLENLHDFNTKDILIKPSKPSHKYEIIDRLTRMITLVTLNLNDEYNMIISNFLNEHDLDEYPSFQDVFDQFNIINDDHFRYNAYGIFLYLYYTDPKIKKNLKSDLIIPMYVLITYTFELLTSDEEMIKKLLLDLITKETPSTLNVFRTLTRDRLDPGDGLEDFRLAIVKYLILEISW